MSFLRSVARVAKLVALLAGGVARLLWERPATRRERAEWLHRLCARAMSRMGIVVTTQGRFPQRGAVISNHTGYLDILAFAATSPCVFVSKAEIRGWPLLGWMTTMAGTIYVERGRGGSAARAATQMRSAAAGGVPVVFFPEGTTTDGRELLPFHSGVLNEALVAGEPVTAAYVGYSLGQGNAAGATVRDDVAYWGDVVLARHVFRLLGLRNVGVHMWFAEVQVAFSDAARTDRKLAAVEARDAVLALRTAARERLLDGEAGPRLSGQERPGA